MTITLFFPSRKNSSGTIKQGVKNNFAKTVNCFYKPHEHTFGIQVTTNDILQDDFLIFIKSFVSPNFWMRLKSWVIDPVFSALVPQHQIDTLVSMWQSTKAENERLYKNKKRNGLKNKKK